MEGLATLLRSIKEGDNNEDDDSEEDNDRELDSNSDHDSEDEHRDKGAAGDEGESKLFQSLSRIVNRYRQGKVQNLLSELQDLLTAGEQPDRKRSYRDVAAKGITPKQQTKVTKQQLTKQQPSNNSRQQPIRKEKEWRKRRLNKAKWRDNEIMGYRALMESLEDGAGPTSKVAVLTLEEAKNARELADLHMIIDKFWIVLDDQPNLEYTDRHMSLCPKEQAEIHVVDLERAGPTRRWTIPLRLPAGQWPIPEPRIEKVQETLEPVELTAIRVTVVREYTDPKIWKKIEEVGADHSGVGHVNQGAGCSHIRMATHRPRKRRVHHGIHQGTQKPGGSPSGTSSVARIAVSGRGETQNRPREQATKSTVGGKGNRRNVHGLLRQGGHASQCWESENHLEERRKQCAGSGRSIQRTSWMDQSLHPGQPALVGTQCHQTVS